MREATDTNLKLLYDAVVEESILPVADEFRSELSQTVRHHIAKVAQVGRFFASQADRREAGVLRPNAMDSVRDYRSEICDNVSDRKGSYRS